MEAARGAAADDLDAVVALAQRLREEVATQRGGDLWALREARLEPLRPQYASLLGRDDALLVVGTYEHVVIGFGAVEIALLSGGVRLGVITDLYVDPEVRGTGVGEAVLAMLTGFCAGAGCRGVDALALPGQRATKNFFEAAGFTARALVMHRSLERDERPSG